MSILNVIDVVVHNNPCTFLGPFQFEITFECPLGLDDELEWKLIYVGSAESEEYDQVLDSILVGPIPPGINKFMFETIPPNPAEIPPSDLLGVTIVFLSCSFQQKEFVRVGYYVTSKYDDDELNENPPSTPILEKLVRTIIDDEPRMTVFSMEEEA